MPFSCPLEATRSSTQQQASAPGEGRNSPGSTSAETEAGNNQQTSAKGGNARVRCGSLVRASHRRAAPRASRSRSLRSLVGSLERTDSAGCDAVPRVGSPSMPHESAERTPGVPAVHGAVDPIWVTTIQQAGRADRAAGGKQASAPASGLAADAARLLLSEHREAFQGGGSR